MSRVLPLIAMLQQGEGESSWGMASDRGRAVPFGQALGYGIQGHAPPPANFLRELQPAAAAYFGELEEALIHGTCAAGVDPVMIESDAHTKCKRL
uniref:Uncharacterized protein n=1 Tax=Aegilops tauschii subsp. strangulata TaxID=200361 RepID=A0A452Z7W8_AEGTS